MNTLTWDEALVASLEPRPIREESKPEDDHVVDHEDEPSGGDLMQFFLLSSSSNIPRSATTEAAAAAASCTTTSSSTRTHTRTRTLGGGDDKATKDQHDAQDLVMRSFLHQLSSSNNTSTFLPAPSPGERHQQRTCSPPFAGSHYDHSIIEPTANFFYVDDLLTSPILQEQQQGQHQQQHNQQDNKWQDLLLPRTTTPHQQGAASTTVPPTTTGDGEGSVTPPTSSSDSSWSRRFQELQDFRAAYGHCMVPSSWPENTPFTQWVKRQRYQYTLLQEGRESNITPHRLAKLENVGFVWDSHSALWEERLAELEEFRNQHGGRTNVPSKYPENPQLAIWAKCRK
jgi:hypothetical protein